MYLIVEAICAMAAEQVIVYFMNPSSEVIKSPGITRFMVSQSIIQWLMLIWDKIFCYFINKLDYSYNIIMESPLQNSNQLSTNAFIFVFAKTGEADCQPIARVDFSPISSSIQKQSLSVQQRCKFKKTFPVFNNDAHYYTPGFIIQDDYRRFFEGKKQELLDLHQLKVSVLQEKEQTLIPKPQKRNSACSMCKIAFDDYLNHIALPQHIHNLHQSQFYNHILQLSKAFAQKKKKISKIKHKKGEQRRSNIMKGNIKEANLRLFEQEKLDCSQMSSKVK